MSSCVAGRPWPGLDLALIWLLMCVCACVQDWGVPTAPLERGFGQTGCGVGPCALVACITWPAPPDLHRLACITRPASPGLRHLVCITWPASPDLPTDCLPTYCAIGAYDGWTNKCTRWSAINNADVHLFVHPSYVRIMIDVGCLKRRR